MKTQCPHCKSRYAIDDKTVDSFGGFVRCGNCNYKFNVHDQVLPIRHRDKLPLRKEPQFDYSDEQDDHRVEPKIETESSDDDLNIRLRDLDENYEEDIFIEPTLEPIPAPAFEPERDDDNEVMLDDEHEPVFTSLLDIDEEKINQADIEKDEPEFDEDEITGAEDSAEDVSSDEIADELIDQAAHSDWDSLEVLDEHSSQLTDQEAEFFSDSSSVVQEDEDTSIPMFADFNDAEEVEDESPLLSLINDDADSPTGAGASGLLAFFASAAKFLVWAGVAVLLMYLLLGQIKDTLYPAYKHYPAVQNMRASMCEYLPCSEAKYDPLAYEIVVSRMDEINAPARQLHISLFMLNKAALDQVYPNVLISLKRLDGSIAGQRIFSAQEYFKSHDSLIAADGRKASAGEQKIKTQKLGKVIIKLDNPPVDAVGFEAKIVQ